MSFLETTLSSPLLQQSAIIFLKLYQGESDPRYTNSEVHHFVKQLQKQSFCPSPELLQLHTAHDTPLLSVIGQTRPELDLKSISQNLKNTKLFIDKLVNCIYVGLKQEINLACERLLKISQTSMIDDNICNHYQYLSYWVNVIETCVRASQKRTWMPMMNTLCSRRFVIVQLSNRSILMPYDTALMFKDMMYSRFIIILLSNLDSKFSRTSHNLRNFINWGEEVLELYGNEGYELIKGIESLVKVRIIDRVEKWLDSSSQALNMVSKYIEKERALNTNPTLIRKLWKLLSNIDDLSQLSEMFGFLKLLGHPYVNPVRGCEKVQKLVHEYEEKDLTACRSLGVSFCHLYTRGYISKHGKWPPLKFLSSLDRKRTRLEILYRREHPVLSFGITQYDPEDWNETFFLPHQIYNLGDDILSLISDKALSYTRSCFDSVWFRKLDYTPPRPTTSKRVLEQLLQTKDFDMQKIIHTVQTNNIPFDWKIVSVSPKEREMKLEPRMFSKMVLEMRSFFVLAEQNLKSGIFKVMKEQTMTLNRQQLLTRFLDITKDKGNRWVKLNVEIDFSSWNLHFDTMNTDPVGIRLNEIYGEPAIYTTAHRFFNECLIVLDSADYPPEGLTKETRKDVLTGNMYLDTVWSGHSRGFEGISQGMWTAITMALGHYAIQDLEIPFTMNGQGDNQVYCFDIYIPDSIENPFVRDYVRKLEMNILTRLSKAASQIGHEIKPEECMCSTSFFSYGKEMFANGEYIPSLSKFISRIFPTTSSNVPSTYEYISTVSSGGTASTEKSNESLTCFILTKFIEHLTISRELKFSMIHERRLSKAFLHLCGPSIEIQQQIIDLLTLIPGNLGGLPISSILEFLYRGHSDPLSSSLASLHIYHYFPGIREYITCLTKGWFFKKEPSNIGLILDPYSLPFSKSSPPSSVVAGEVLETLFDVVRNDKIAPLKLIVNNTDKENLIKWLMSSRPFYPKLAHDLYKSSLFGVVDALSKRFTNTRTLINLSRSTDNDLTKVSINADYKYIRDILKHMICVYKVDRNDLYHYDTSTYHTLMSLRNYWNVGPLHGVTNLHPLTSGKVLFLPEDYSQIKLKNEIVVMCMTGTSYECLTTRGPVVPFLGTKTEDKSVGKWIKPVDSSPPLVDVLKILTIQDMMSLPGSNVHESLEKLAKTRTTLDTQLLKNFIKVKIGGTVAHRYQTRDDARGSFVNISPNLPTHLSVSTNNAKDLGITDYPFDFQEAITCLQGVLAWKLSGINLCAPFGLILQVNLDLMDPVTDHIIETPNQVTLDKPTPSSYYLTVNEITLSSNSLKSAKFTDDDIFPYFKTVDGDIDHALTNNLLIHITGQIGVGVKFGHTLGTISYKRLIDVPEVRQLSYKQFKFAYIKAIWLKLSYPLISTCNKSTRKFDKIYPMMLRTEIRRSLPGLYGTLKEVYFEPKDKTLCLGLGDPTQGNDLLRLMADIFVSALTFRGSITCQLYLQGTSSISRSLFCHISYESMRLLFDSNDKCYESVKIIFKILYQIRKLQDEPQLIRYLQSFIISLNATKLFTKVKSSPEVTLRSLRNQIIIPTPINIDPTIYRYDLQQFTLLKPEEIFQSTKLYSHPIFRPVDWISSWWNRRNGCLEQAIRWSPLTSCLPKSIHDVLLIGIGDGKIGPALNPSWIVTGLDLGVVLAKQGQNMVDYQPPHISNQFRLHPASWALGGDITDQKIIQVLQTELISQKYDLVIIDVDSVDILVRLKLRQHIASYNIPCVCKILISPVDVSDLVQSFITFSKRDDKLWTIDNFQNKEVYVGFSDAPLGLYTNSILTTQDDFLVPTIISKDVYVNRESSDDIEHTALVLTGDFTDSDHTKINFEKCRTIKPYLPDSIISPISLVIHLVERRCPRVRIKALLLAFKNNWIIKFPHNYSAVQIQSEINNKLLAE